MKILTTIFLAAFTILFTTACGGTASTPETVSEPAPQEQAAPATNELSQPESAMADAETTEEPSAAGETMENAMPAETSESVTATEETSAAMPEESEPAAEIASADTSAATEEPPVEAAMAEVDWLTVEGKTADNLAYLGNPEAAVTIIDYSDFL